MFDPAELFSKVSHLALNSLGPISVSAHSGLVSVFFTTTLQLFVRDKSAAVVLKKHSEPRTLHLCLSQSYVSKINMSMQQFEPFLHFLCM